MAVVRHITATGFVVHDSHVLLHWHPKIRAWLPPGGHIEPNEDPVQAVLREVKEETGVTAEVVCPAPEIALDYPAQLPPPYTILIEDIHDPVNGFHQHIDMIYFCRPVGPAATPKPGWRWVGRARLADGARMGGEGAEAVPPPNDVCVLAQRAFLAVDGS